MSRSLEGEPRPPQVVTTNLTTPFSGKTSTPNLQNRQLPRPPHNNTPKTPTQNCQTVNDCKLQPTQTPAPPKMSELTTRSIHHKSRSKFHFLTHPQSLHFPKHKSQHTNPTLLQGLGRGVRNDSPSLLQELGQALQGHQGQLPSNSFTGAFSTTNQAPGQETNSLPTLLQGTPTEHAPQRPIILTSRNLKRLRKRNHKTPTNQKRNTLKAKTPTNKRGTKW